MQGPFVIKSGTSVDLKFCNVFQTTVSYTITVSDPAFAVGNCELQQLEPSTETSIVVSYNAPSSVTDSKAPFVGKLIVRCSRPYSIPDAANYQWIFYLRGIVSDTKDG